MPVLASMPRLVNVSAILSSGITRNKKNDVNLSKFRFLKDPHWAVAGAGVMRHRL
jgi:hypothetical protein